MPNESDILGGQTRAAPPQLSDGVRTHRCGCEVSQNIGEGNDTASTVSEASSRNMNSIRVESRDGDNSSVTENTIATTANIDLDVPEYDASVTTIDDTASEFTDAGVLVFNNTNNRSPILQGCCTCKHCTCRQCRLRQLICTLADIGSGVAASGRSAPSPPMADSDSSARLLTSLTWAGTSVTMSPSLTMPISTSTWSPSSSMMRKWEKMMYDMCHKSKMVAIVYQQMALRISRPRCL